MYSIQVMTEAAEPDGFKWRDEENAPGVYVLEQRGKYNMSGAEYILCKWCKGIICGGFLMLYVMPCKRNSAQ